MQLVVALALLEGQGVQAGLVGELQEVAADLVEEVQEGLVEEVRVVLVEEVRVVLGVVREEGATTAAQPLGAVSASRPTATPGRGGGRMKIACCSGIVCPSLMLGVDCKVGCVHVCVRD